MKIFTRELLISLITAVVTVSGTWYFTYYIQRPSIHWYSRPYYKIDDIAIGNVYILNEGGKPDEDVTLTLNLNLEDKAIKIVDYYSDYTIKHIDNKTTIILKELKPGDAADITFKADGKDDDFGIYSFTSKYSNIYQDDFIFRKKWWFLSWWSELIILFVALSVGFFGGWFLKERKACKPIETIV